MADFKKIIPKSMIGATLPGNSTVEMKEFEVPTPGFGQVLVVISPAWLPATSPAA